MSKLLSKYTEFNVMEPCPEMPFGDRVRLTRMARGMRQGALAREMACSQSAVSDVERGRNTGSTLMNKFAQALGVDAIWLEFGTVSNILPSGAVPQLNQETLIKGLMANGLSDVRALSRVDTNWVPHMSGDEKPGDRVFSIRVGNDTNSPAICSGDTVFVDPDADILSGHIAAVLVAGSAGYEVVFRRLVAEGNTLFLEVVHPGYTQLNQVGFAVETPADLLLTPPSQDTRVPVFLIGRAIQKSAAFEF